MRGSWEDGWGHINTHEAKAAGFPQAVWRIHMATLLRRACLRQKRYVPLCGSETPQRLGDAFMCDFVI